MSGQTQCKYCGTALRASTAAGDGPLTCRICGEPAETPQEGDGQTVRAWATAQVDDAELMAHVNVLAERDAEKIAWVGAQPAGAKARNTGMIVTVFAIVALATGITTLVEGAAHGVSPIAATASVIFGAIGALVGGAVWQAGAGAIREEFSRRMPDTVARLRREYAATYHVRQQIPSAGRQTRVPSPPPATF